MSGLPAGLPVPDAAQCAHEERVTAHLRGIIDAAGGAISFHEFMHQVLYAPGLGYYSAGARKFGAAGDFVTAPEISSLFAECLAGHVAAVLENLGGGVLLEPGAGSGGMAADMLGELERLGALPEEYRILEVGAELRARQRERLKSERPGLEERVGWIDGPPEEPFRGVVVANEVIDALPVERFRITGSGPARLGVAWEARGLREVEMEADQSLLVAVAEIEQALGKKLAMGFESELRPMLKPWIASLCAGLEAGIVLCIDYGLSRRELYMAERRRGTLRCHYRHRAHDEPLRLIGLQDLTAWVDFTALADAGLDIGLEVLGFTTQAHFLMDNGLEGRLASRAQGSDARRLEYAQQAKRLILPGEMGERFKVMALGRGYDGPLPGFGLKDLRGSL